MMDYINYLDKSMNIVEKGVETAVRGNFGAKNTCLLDRPEEVPASHDENCRINPCDCECRCQKCQPLLYENKELSLYEITKNIKEAFKAGATFGEVEDAVSEGKGWHGKHTVC